MSAPRIFDNMAQGRTHRNGLLIVSDFTQLPSIVTSGVLTAAKQTEWETYRVALRGLPQDPANSAPEVIVWPTPPAP